MKTVICVELKTSNFKPLENYSCRGTKVRSVSMETLSNNVFTFTEISSKWLVRSLSG